MLHDIKINPQRLQFRCFVNAAIISILCTFSLTDVLQAGEFVCPPEFSSTFFQTNGPDGLLRWGDWWSSSNAEAGNQPHMFEIFVPCEVDSDFVVEIQLYDPECYQTGSEIDEFEGVDWDTTSFRLVAPDGTTEIAQVIFPPLSSTSEQWNTFADFTVRGYGCGIYRLYASTYDDDQNAYKIKVVEADPDGAADSGDEINIAPVETSYQHNGGGCSTFWFYVPDKPELRLSNFDMDEVISVNYTDPDGNSIAGTVSANRLWNNGGGVPFPPPGGDVFTNPTSGWWQADICIDDGNQYVFYAEGAVFIDYMPHAPDLTVDKDNGQTQSYEGQEMTYAIIIENTGSGPALNVALTDTLPSGTSYTSASGNANYSYNAPYEIITWDMGVIEPSESDTVFLTVSVGEEAESPIENRVYLSYEDLFFNEHIGIYDNDQDTFVNTGSIGDYVWHDADGDALQDGEESGIENVILYLVNAAGDTIDTDTTNADGNYLFNNVLAGQYTLYINSATLPDDAILTTGNLPHSVTLSEDQVYSSADFGFDSELIPVELTLFEAVASTEMVLLKWRTQSETENLGFNILRSNAYDGKYRQINPKLIDGAGTSEKMHNYFYEDRDVKGGKTYYYLLEDVDYSGNTSTHGPVTATVAPVPKDYGLEQNYPNPFNPSTTIKFSLKEGGHVKLTIYNMIGQRVQTLINKNMNAGVHNIGWNSRDMSNSLVPSGVYYYSIEVNDFKAVRRMIFAK